MPMTNKRHKELVRDPSLNRVPRMAHETEDEKLLESPHEQGAATKGFTHSDPWRVLRIMGEFVEGFDTLAELGPAITIFGSARVKPDDPMYQATVETARLLGEAGYAIITGGGPGIMEAGNRGAQEGGVPSIGLNIELPFEQGSNQYVDVSIDFRYFFVRKTMFVKYAQAFIIFPGGFGTMDELFESLTLIQTGKIKIFPVILYGSLAEGKIAPADLDLVMVADSPEQVRDMIVQSLGDEGQRDEQEAGSRAAARDAYQPERTEA
jgi:uncharacterized protein (TIGR00730 family)